MSKDYNVLTLWCAPLSNNGNYFTQTVVSTFIRHCVCVNYMWCRLNLWILRQLTDKSGKPFFCSIFVPALEKSDAGFLFCVAV